MIKTIKVKKQLRLDELIKYIFENGIKGNTHLIDYQSNLKTNVFVDFSGQVAVQGSHFGNELFTVEVEEDITEDTWFRNLIQIYETVPGNARLSHWDDTTTKEIINWNEKENTKKVYALIENKLQLVWEAE